ncbi:MAG: hypothetical protein JWN23_742 [Rhodocyclales bacterium]|nr:hypothetical protein [Rhodocyclales bacterium]
MANPAVERSMAIVIFKTVARVLAFLAGGILSLVGSLALAAAFAAPNSIRLWTDEHVTYDLDANAWSLPLGAVFLVLGVLLITLALRKRGRT